MKTKTHYKGRYLSLVERDDWEFATRTNPVVAVLVAWLPPLWFLLMNPRVDAVRKHFGMPGI